MNNHVLMSISFHLDFSDTISMLSTCSSLRSLLYTDWYWKQKLIEKYGMELYPSETTLVTMSLFHYRETVKFISTEFGNHHHQMKMLPYWYKRLPKFILEYVIPYGTRTLGEHQSRRKRLPDRLVKMIYNHILELRYMPSMLSICVLSELGLESLKLLNQEFQMDENWAMQILLRYTTSNPVVLNYLISHLQAEEQIITVLLHKLNSDDIDIVHHFIFQSLIPASSREMLYEVSSQQGGYPSLAMIELRDWYLSFR
jgi:hypothetical protein